MGGILFVIRADKGEMAGCRRCRMLFPRHKVLDVCTQCGHQICPKCYGCHCGEAVIGERQGQAWGRGEYSCPEDD